jgi:phosphate/sulfate permease
VPVGNTPTRRNMAVRRKKRTARRKRSFSVNLIETGAGLAFLDAANAGQAAQSMLKGDIAGGLKTLGDAFKNQKDQMIRIGAGALAAKLVVSSLGGNKIVGSVGPLKLRA